MSTQKLTSFCLVLVHMIWIGWCAVAMVWANGYLLGTGATQIGNLEILIFCGTIFGYHFAQPDLRLRAIAWIAGVIAGYCYLGVAAPVRSLLLVPFLVWASYYGWKWPLRAGLRWHIAWKPIVVAFAWAWVTVLLPFKNTPDWSLLLFFCARMVFFVALALPYDLHDRAYDQQRGLSTFAHRLGVSRTLRWMDIAFLTAFVLNLIQYAIHPFGQMQLLALFLSYFLSSCLLRYLFRQNAPESGRKILIDAPMPLQWLFLYFAQGC